MAPLQLVRLEPVDTRRPRRPGCEVGASNIEIVCGTRRVVVSGVFDEALLRRRAHGAELVDRGSSRRAEEVHREDGGKTVDRVLERLGQRPHNEHLEADR